MKPDEKDFFKILMDTHPDFLDAKRWEEGPDPPDVIVIDGNGRKLGVELTEWLIAEQTTRSITLQEHEARWLASLDSEHHPQPKNFGSVQVSFRSDTKFSNNEEAEFRREFYELIRNVDEHWESEFSGTPQKMWNDFAQYPTLRKHIQSLWFYDQPLLRPPAGARWVIAEPTGGGYDPKWASDALLARITDKINKLEYPSLRSRYSLAELILVLHYGIRGILHNTPFYGGGRRIEDVIDEARSSLSVEHGPFDRVFLYFAFNEGRIIQLYP